MTAVEWLLDQKMALTSEEFDDIIQQAKEMEKQQAKDYAIFAVNCVKKELPVLDFEDYIKL
jgi:uncharacterized tellurite resistance protein B-like protein